MQQSNPLVRPYENASFTVATPIARIQGEVVRKTLHLFIAFVPVLAAMNLPATFALLAVGTIFYAFAEASRLRGMPVAVVSDITLIASRERDRDRFVLGPVTLSLGALLALMLYPMPAATIAILALAFGDGIASLAGTVIRGPRVPFLKGKTLSGSIACFAAVFFVTLRVTGKFTSALVVGAAATFLEALPVGNFDNIVIPMGVGFAAWVLNLA